jgi:hypothetical protein
MSRSIHTTKRDLVKERKFALTDGVSNKDITTLERRDIQKRTHKINEKWKRDAHRSQAVAHAKIRVTETGPKREIQKSRGQISDDV